MVLFWTSIALGIAGVMLSLGGLATNLNIPVLIGMVFLLASLITFSFVP